MLWFRVFCNSRVLLSSRAFSAVDSGCLGVFWGCFRVLGLDSQFQGLAKYLRLESFVREKCAIYRHELRVADWADVGRVRRKRLENGQVSGGGGLETADCTRRQLLYVWVRGGFDGSFAAQDSVGIPPFCGVFLDGLETGEFRVSRPGICLEPFS